MKKIKPFVWVMLFSCFTMSGIKAQSIDERLWGTWKLSTIVLTVQGITQEYTMEALLANKSKLPRNMFTGLLFFEDQVGVNSTETEFVPTEELSLKGTFTTDNGKLVISLRGKQPRSFAYEFENSFLRIRYTQGDTQFYLVYKLILKPVE